MSIVEDARPEYKGPFTEEELVKLGAEHPEGDFSSYLMLDILGERYVYEPIGDDSGDNVKYHLRNIIPKPDEESAPAVDS